MTTLRWSTAVMLCILVIPACDWSMVEPPAERSGSVHELGASATTAHEMGGFEVQGLIPEPTRTAAQVAAVRSRGVGTAAQGPPGGFPVVIVLNGPGGGAGGAVVDNFADAMAKVAPGGTIRVGQGTFIVDEVEIDRPVTIEPLGNHQSLIHADAGQFSFGIFDVPEGVITFRGLNFEVPEGARSAIQARFVYPEIVVEDCTFELAGLTHPSLTAATAGVEAGFNDTGEGMVRVTGSSFRGGMAGTFAFGGGILDVASSHFRDHTNSAIQYQTQASGTVRDSEIGPCGPFGCVRIFASMVDVLDNSLSQSRTDVTAFENHVVLYTEQFVGGALVGPAGGTARGNHFDGCGSGLCLLVTNGAEADLIDNVFTIPAEHGTRWGIVGSFGASLRVHDNMIHGIGGDPAHPDGYAIGFGFPGGGGIAIQDDATAELFGNEVVNGHFGISVMAGGEVTAGSDNTVRVVFHGLMIGPDPLHGIAGAHAVRIQRSDFAQYRNAIAGAGTGQASDLRCNWWGSADGPVLHDMGFGIPADPALYTPWATEPVANDPGVSCGL